jgi:hypothetical protein
VAASHTQSARLASETPLQEKAWSSYLASEAEWPLWDACKLAPGYDGPSMQILIDQVSRCGPLFL